MRTVGIGARLLFACPLLCCCGGGAARDVDAGSAAFVALEGDFACYRNWPSGDGGTMAVDGLSLAISAQRTIYINQVPPAGSTTFPVGTILVKETAGAQTFAMAKRGGGFNPPVDNWEWFELSTPTSNPPTDCKPLIDWRGTAPPPGDVYGGQFTACNGCHQEASDNDYVQGDWPKLKP